ncbi:butyrylcholinesterase isoform X2 [Saccoglossus kowalevskii]|uniref:Carboxylic ester hydrolase n=1 Tax=Saccoglossus kowalevskii TaxID=10224 RepID=A0ABM0MZ26_SACKO|nr:PREDICTED: butyrylcholinesterase isoform X1 [Saccoglossus kowalevskii]
MTAAKLIDNAIYVAGLVVIVSTIYVHGQEPIVNTRNGQLRGTRRDLFNGNVDSFLGIPYANPPVGELRFKVTEPYLRPWEGVRDATEFSNACSQVPVQSDFRGETMWDVNAPISEDCLYLNVWSPFPTPSKAAVMVWIPGGGLTSGASSVDLYDGATLADAEQVIVVSVNYRLGVLGFLALRDTQAPGNMGFLDQAMALQWVADNIDYFGGDPERVTIFGESAGAISVGVHLFSSQNLFRRAILQSGNVFFPESIVTYDRSEKLALTMTDNLGCGLNYLSNETVDNTKILECFNSKSTEEIVLAQYVDDVRIPTPGVVDGTFLKDSPLNLLKDGLYESTEILIGDNLNEGTWFLPYMAPQYFSLDQKPILNHTTFEEFIEFYFSMANALTHAAISFEYTNWLEPENSADLVAGASDVVGDFLITCPTDETAKLYSQYGNDVYRYLFSELASNTPWLDWYGVLHGDEIPFVFGTPLYPENGFSDSEKVLSREMMKYWANFAKTGNPNKESDDDVSDNAWPRFDLEEQQYIIFETPDNGIGQKLKSRKCAFWRDLYPKVKDATAEQRSIDDPVTCFGQCVQYTLVTLLITSVVSMVL